MAPSRPRPASRRQKLAAAGCCCARCRRRFGHILWSRPQASVSCDSKNTRSAIILLRTDNPGTLAARVRREEEKKKNIIGVPLFSAWNFAKNWRRLNSPDTASLTARLSTPLPLQAAPKPWWYGDRSTFYFVVRDYKPEYFFFEIVDFAQVCTHGNCDARS